MAGRAYVSKPAFSITTRTGQAELHGARHLSDAALAVALRTYSRRSAGGSGAAAGIADLLPDNVELHLRSAYGFPEIDVEPILEVGTFFRSRAGFLAAASAEELAENIPEVPGALSRIGAAALVDILGKIKSAEAHPARRTSSRAGTSGRNIFGIETMLVVDLPFLSVAQDVISFLNFLEAIFGGLVAGLQVGMIFSRQPAIRLADLIRF